jgi:Protein of unknown function (DUF1524)
VPGPTNNLNRVFNTAPVAIGNQAPVAAAIRSYLSGRRRYWPSDTEVRRSISTWPFYWTGRGPQRTFVLRRIEESYQAHEPVDFDAAKLTIEHILPQTATDEWLEVLAAEVTDEGGPKELHDSLVHTLGNITLWAWPALTDIQHQGFAPVRMSDHGEHGEEAPAAPLVHC